VLRGTKLVETTICISKETSEALENMRENLKAASLDEVIQSLLKNQRKEFLEATFGVDRGKLAPFTEADRGEDREL